MSTFKGSCATAFLRQLFPNVVHTAIIPATNTATPQMQPQNTQKCSWCESDTKSKENLVVVIVVVVVVVVVKAVDVVSPETEALCGVVWLKAAAAACCTW